MIYIDPSHFDHTGAPISDLLYFYTAIMRPILEYASPVWHSKV